MALMRIEDYLLKTDRFNIKTHTNKSKKIFICKNLEDISFNFLFRKDSDEIFANSFDIISKLRITVNPSDSDFILVPHDWIEIYKNQTYINYLISLSKIAPLIVLNTGDRSPNCKLPNSIQLRTYLHPGESKINKVLVPYPIRPKNFNLRKWKITPTISFIGFIPKLGIGTLTSYNPRFILHPFNSSYYINRKLSSLKLSKLSGDFNVVNVARKSFTLRSKNPNLTQEIDDFNESLRISDYILCPRGAANTSIRFYEALSSGATPVLIESGTDLPEISDYRFWSRNIVKIKLFAKWNHALKNDWKFLQHSDNYTTRQLENFTTFKEELNLEVYLTKLFASYLSK
jgi:hypothetical protein